MELVRLPSRLLVHRVILEWSNTSYVSFTLSRELEHIENTMLQSNGREQGCLNAVPYFMALFQDKERRKEVTCSFC